MNKLAIVPLALMMVLGACKQDEPGGKSNRVDYPDKAQPSQTEKAGPTKPATAAANPHGKMATSQGTVSMSPGPGPADLGGIEVTIPKTWTPETVTSRMRAAQYAMGTGDARVEVVVFYFGARGAGGVEANLERWQKQFSKLEGEPKRANKMVGQMKVSTIDMAGTFGGGPPMRPQAAKKAPQGGVRMVGAIIEAPAGAYYFKMTGPKAEVEKVADGFADMIDSAKPSKP
jgi:hypothetical protein